MMGYIIGTAIGSIVLLIVLSFAISIHLKKIKKKKLIKTIGAKAEVKVNSDIKVWAKQTKNLFIDSSLYKYDGNKLFEVDSIIITTRAMIIVEIKSINGSVSGDSTEPFWTKIIGENTFKIANAQMQNQKHIDHIIKMLNVKVPIISLIIFSNRTRQVNIANLPGHALIIRHVELFETLDKIDKSLPFSIDDKEMKYLRNQLIGKQTKNKNDIKKHLSFFIQRRNGDN